MGFCKQCGTDLNGANFCPSCGTSANEQVAVQQNNSTVPAGADVRQRSIADMEHMMKYFGAKSEVYDEYETICQEVEQRTMYSSGGWIAAAVICFLIGIFSKGVFFFIATAAFIALSIVFKKKNKQKLEVAIERQTVLSNEISTYYADYGYCAVGLEYTKPSTLSALYDLIRKGRASNPSDAINLYLDDLHKAALERSAAETAAAAQETARNTKQAAKSAKKAAAYSSANFWFK